MEDGLHERLLLNERQRTARSHADAEMFQKEMLDTQLKLEKAKITEEALRLTAASLLIRNESLLETIGILEQKLGQSGILEEAKAKMQEAAVQKWKHEDPYFEINGARIDKLIVDGQTESLAVNSIKYKKYKK